MPSLRCLFITQGEGRGHMTQALALRSLLEEAGHEVCGVLVGCSPNREVPDFFLKKIGAPVDYIPSIHFALDGQHRAVRMASTLWQGARHVGHFRESFDVIEAALRRYRPDVVINFYEVMTGLYYRRYRPEMPMVCVAHQYMFEHPSYRFPKKHFWLRTGLRLFTRATAFGAARTLALSLYPASDLPARGLSVLPPLLRQEVFAQPLGCEEPFLLVYLLNSGYAEQVKRWHAANPAVRLHCFWDRADAAPVEEHGRLTFHRLDDEKFLSKMARCRGLVCTAGFESVSEAMYLGKPVLMVPVEGHFEQHCNALDGRRAGAGTHSRRFDMHRLTQYLPHYDSPAPRFRRWVDAAQGRYVREIEKAAGVRSPAALARGPVLTPAAG